MTVAQRSLRADPLSGPRQLIDLVDYQDGSVVSRVLFRSTGGVMTVFAFAEGQGLTEHSSPHDAVVQILEGDVSITVGDEEHHVSEGELLHLPSTVPHALHGGAPFKMLLTILKRERAASEATRADA